MNPELLVSFLLEFLAKSALILAAAALINRAWLRASAAQRHLVWCAALATVLLLPLTRLHAPRWTVPLQRVTLELSRQPRTDLPPIESVATSAATANPLPAAPRWRWPDWQHAIVIVWSVGAGLLLAARLLGSVRLVWLRKTAHPLTDPRTQRMATEIFTELGIRRTVELRLSPAGGVPLTWGSLRPVLMLPAEALAWSEVRLAAALRHEAGHIARGDHFTRSIAHLACALYWPNPLVWLAARSLRTAQEQATDDLVLRGGTAPEEYASQLFEIARSLATQHRLAQHAVAMASPSTLERRMLAIVDERRDRRPLTIGAITGGVLAVALTLGLATAAQVQAQKEAATPVGGAEKVETTPASDVSRSTGPQIEIAAKFIEVSGDHAGLPEFFKEPDPKAKEALRAILSDEEMQVAVRTLSSAKGVDLLSAPRVTTHSKQNARIEIGQEFRYATDWDKDAGTGAWKGKTFATKNLGVKFDVTPEANADGTISLHMVPEVTELEGFQNLDAKPGSAKLLKGDESAEGHRTQPVFSTRKIDTTVTAKSGDTVVLGGPSRVDIQTVEDRIPILGDIPFVGRPFRSTSENHIKRRLIVLVTASTLKEAPPVAAEANPNPMMEIVLPRVEFKAAKLSDAAALLLAKGREAGATALNIVVVKPPTPEPIVTLSMSKVSIAEAVQNLAEISGTGVRRDGNTYVLGEKIAADAGKPAHEIPPTATTDADPATGVILPRVDFREAKLSEAVEFLSVKGRAAGLTPFNIVVVKAPMPEPVMTLSLTDVPLTDAIRYVAELAGLRVRRDASAFVLEPAPTPATK